MNVAILVRVSQASQSYDRQITDLKTYAERMNYDVVGEFSEKITGAAKNEDREALSDLFAFIQDNQVDKVLVWELSRLGRSTLEVLKSVEEFHKQGVSLYVLNYNLETLNTDGSPNAIAQLLITMLAEFSRVERASIQQRLSSGYQKHLKNGGKVGRYKGVGMSDEALLEKHKDVVKLLKKERTIREIAELTKHSTRTVMKVKKVMSTTS